MMAEPRLKFVVLVFAFAFAIATGKCQEMEVEGSPWATPSFAPALIGIGGHYYCAFIESTPHG